MLLPLKPYSKKYYFDKTKRLEVVTIPTRSDNYTFLVLNEQKDKAILIDSADHTIVLDTLEHLKLKLECILLTHHHFDHVDGLDVILSKHPNANLYCSKTDANRGLFSSKSTEVKGTDQLDLFGEPVSIIDSSGHTISHLSYYFTHSEALFCGDTLFSLGCGRVFEKKPNILEIYFQTMKRLKHSVKPEALVFCAHEYTSDNLIFCEKENFVVDQARVELLERLLKNNFEKTVPSDFSFELQHNPFLNAPSSEQLKRIRTLKDNF